MEPREPKAFFEDRGYLIVEDLLSPEEVERSQREIHRLHRLAADLEVREDQVGPRLHRHAVTLSTGVVRRSVAVQPRPEAS